MHKGLCILILFLVFCISCPEYSLCGTKGASVDLINISDAVATLGEGDTLFVEPGIYSPTRTGETFPIVITDGIVIIGEDRDSCILDAEGTERVLLCENLDSPYTTIKNLTLRGGFSESVGAGIKTDSSILKIENCRVTGNYSSAQGGGIAIVDGGDVTIESCLIDSNSTDGRGGGIYCDTSSPYILNNTLSSNSGRNGGGISCTNGSSPVISSNTFEYNTATNQAGGLECKDRSSPTVSMCSFEGNTATKGGGLSIQSDSEPTIIDNQFVRNRGETGGGAIFSSTPGRPVIKRNLIDDNYGGRNGGGIFLYSTSEALIDSNTITNNQAGPLEGGEGYGGGILCYNGPIPTISNNIIHNNSANIEGGGIHMNLDCGGLIENNDIQYNTSGYEGEEEEGVGAGIFLNRSHPVVRYNLISNNTSERGAGGIFVQDDYPCNEPSSAYPLITGNIITYNTAYYDGGGIATSHCDSSIITDNVISNNTAVHGGGGINVRYNSRTIITGNVIEENISQESGGGALFITDSSKPIISGNTIRNNSTVNRPGGAIDCLQGTSPIISDNQFLNNSGWHGGAINIRDEATVSISRNTFAGNTAVSSGGAIFSNGRMAVLLIQNNTFYDNEGSYGETIETGVKPWALIENNIFSNESSEEPLSLGNDSKALVRYNCFWNETGRPVGSAFDDSLENFFANPEFADISLMDFHLIESSPCIDAGYPESPPDPDSTRSDIGRYYFHQDAVGIDSPGESISKLPVIYLDQNYPNPFNPMTNINVTIGAEQLNRVEISVFNSRGRFVIKLFDGPLGYGVHRFIWNGVDHRGTHVGSGIYLCKIRTDEGTSSIKMILAK